MKKYEFSKLIAIISVLASFTLSIIVVCCELKGMECSNITTITVVAWAETAASNAAYYNKAKKENLPKTIMGIYKGLPRNLKEQVDINTLMNNLMG